MEYRIYVKNIKMSVAYTLSDAIAWGRKLLSCDSVSHKNIKIDREDGRIYSFNEYGNCIIEKR